MDQSDLDKLKEEFGKINKEFENDKDGLKNKLSEFINHNSEQIKKAIEKGIEEGSIVLKATGSYLGKVFKLDFIKDSIHKFLGDIFLIATGFYTIGFMIFKAIGSQNIVANSIVSDGSFIFIGGGRCLEMDKKSPSKKDKYTIMKKHEYDYSVFESIEVKIYPFYLPLSVKFGIPQNFNFDKEILLIKQTLIWMHYSDPNPMTVLRKLFGEFNFFRFQEIVFLIKSCVLFNDIFPEKSNLIDNFRRGLNKIIKVNYNSGNFSDQEILTLANSNLINVDLLTQNETN